jgi:hypothetical protein
LPSACLPCVFFSWRCQPICRWRVCSGINFLLPVGVPRWLLLLPKWVIPFAALMLESPLATRGLFVALLCYGHALTHCKPIVSRYCHD